MSKLFDDCDSDIEIKTDNEYAKSYDTWRKKEEINKFKARHGEHALDSENDEDAEDTSDDDEAAVELTEEVEKDFYKTLSMLKKNDPSIYDSKVVFFNKSSENEKPHKKVQKEKKMFLRDYERELLLEKGGIASDSENEEVKKPVNLREAEEKKLKESFKVLDEDSEEDIGTLLKTREQTKEEKLKKEEDYKAWLMGQEKKLKDKEIASSLKPLKDYWTDERLDEGEKFLRDYLLNKRYIEKSNKNYIPTYNEIVEDLSEDEEDIDKQEEFEHKYNFRFEDPDPEFIKRYPRTIEGSLRKEDTRRKVKRQEVKERKAREKEEKMEELRQLRDIKRKEIEEKIEKLKEITGNNEIPFNDDDLEGDFDPEEHDKKMQAIFNEEYYQDGPEEDIKPPIELDDEDALELQPENFDNWTGPQDDETGELHCEDDNFNMDADYDPKATQKELVDNSRRKKKRKRKSKFVEMLSKKRPKFDLNDKAYEKYLDEYYKYECEDIIDDIPCKFKYREVVPNNFGLSVEEILMANDRELNKWCSLKKAVSLRDDAVEKYEQIAYEKKGQNIMLKKKIIPSLFAEEENKSEKTNTESVKTEKDIAGKSTEKNIADRSSEKDIAEKSTENVPSTSSPKKKKRKRVSEHDVENDTIQASELVATDNGHNEEETDSNDKNSLHKKKKKKKYNNDENPAEESMKKHMKDGNNQNPAEKSIKKNKKDGNNQITVEKSMKKNKKDGNNQNPAEKSMKKNKKDINNHNPAEKPMKKNKKDKTNQNHAGKSKKIKAKDLDIGISDSRIACFGWNPKKFKNKLIYGNKDEKK